MDGHSTQNGQGLVPGKVGPRARFTLLALRTAETQAHADWLALSTAARDRIKALPVSRRLKATRRVKWLAPEHRSELDLSVALAVRLVERSHETLPQGAKSPHHIDLHWMRVRHRARTRALSWAAANKILRPEEWWEKAVRSSVPPPEVLSVPHMLEQHADGYRARLIRDVLASARRFALPQFWETPLASPQDILAILHASLEKGVAGWSAKHPPPGGMRPNVEAVSAWWETERERLIEFEGPLLVLISAVTAEEPNGITDDATTMASIADRLSIAAEGGRRKGNQWETLAGDTIERARTARLVISICGKVRQLGGKNLLVQSDATEGREVRQELEALAEELDSPAGRERVRRRDALNRLRASLLLTASGAGLGILPTIGCLWTAGWSVQTAIGTATAALMMPVWGALGAVALAASGIGLLGAGFIWRKRRETRRAYGATAAATVCLWASLWVGYSQPIYRMNDNSSMEAVPLRGATALLHTCRPGAPTEVNGEAVLGCFTLLARPAGLISTKGLLTRSILRTGFASSIQ